jgi:sporulation protein YlmC with PRC-barrel domain
MKPVFTLIVISILSVIVVVIPAVVADIPDKHQKFLEKQEEFNVIQDEHNRKKRRESTQHDLKNNLSMQQISRASKIIGSHVMSFNGESLGNIKELVIDPVNGQVVYAVVSFGGLLGIGSKLFAVPWEALHWTGNKSIYVLDLDKTIFASSPGFNHKHWPDSSNLRDLQREVLNQFYFTKP